MGNGINNSANLPAEVSVWSKVRSFLCQDVEMYMTFYSMISQDKKLKTFYFKKLKLQTILNYNFKELSTQ